MSSQVHINDIGTRLIMTLLDEGSVVDISGASDIDVVLRKPDTSTSTKTGVFYTDGTDGKIKYTSISGDFDQAGTYKIQGIVTLPSGTYHTSISDFKVYCNLI